MQSENDGYGRIVEHALLQHQLSPGIDFLGRLEDELHRPGQTIPALGKKNHRAQQPGRMDIMAAGMHHPGIPGPVNAIVFLFYRQGIDIRPQRNDRSRVCAFQQPDNAGFPAPLDNFHPGLNEDLPDHFRRPVFLETGFRILVQLPPKANDVLLQLRRPFDECFHVTPPAIFNR